VAAAVHGAQDGNDVTARAAGIGREPAQRATRRSGRCTLLSYDRRGLFPRSPASDPGAIDMATRSEDDSRLLATVTCGPVRWCPAPASTRCSSWT
jgi:hypothetical protein